ncbi:MAG: hypothetical protein V4655_06955 [Bdellovibrionota bacterium]
MKIFYPLSLIFFGFLSSLAHAEGKIRIVVSVDWEGRELAPDNIEKMKAFRRDYPDIPLEMFLNAAYYFKADADPKLVTDTIRSTLLPGDEHGLHIHAWKSLIEASGVKFRTEPAFKGPMDLNACTPDCGHDVNISAYSEKELRKVIRRSIATLTKNGFDHPKSFRAGAWQSDKKVMNALAAEGFTLDSSATDAEYLKERWGKTLLYPVVKKNWPETTSSSQPYRVQLSNDKSIVQLPNNGCLADYVTGEQILTAFQANVEKLKENPNVDRYLSIGFHQETAAKYLDKLRSGIDLIRAEAKKQNVTIEFVVPPISFTH